MIIIATILENIINDLQDKISSEDLKIKKQQIEDYFNECKNNYYILTIPNIEKIPNKDKDIYHTIFKINFVDEITVNNLIDFICDNIGIIQGINVLTDSHVFMKSDGIEFFVDNIPYALYALDAFIMGI